MSNSSLSAKSTDREKLSLVKIKEQYNENLKLMRENFYGEMQQLEETYRHELEELYRKTDLMNGKLGHLEQFKG